MTISHEDKERVTERASEDEETRRQNPSKLITSHIYTHPVSFSLSVLHIQRNNTHSLTIRREDERERRER